MKMNESSEKDLRRFLGDVIEDLVDGKVQVRLSDDQLLKLLRIFTKRRGIQANPVELLENWTRDLNRSLSYKNYLIKYVPAVDALSFQWAPPWDNISWATEIRSKNLRIELRQAILSLPFDAFEQLMRQVFVRTKWARDIWVTKVSHDDGIDFEGKFFEDSSGLLLPLVGQAKHWKTKVGSEEIRTFLGSIAVRKDQRNTVGIYVATHGFNEGALRMIRKAPNHIIDLDIDRLADLMISNKIGVTPVSLRGVRLDSSFWDDLNV